MLLRKFAYYYKKKEQRKLSLKNYLPAFNTKDDRHPERSALISQDIQDFRQCTTEKHKYRAYLHVAPDLQC